MKRDEHDRVWPTDFLEFVHREPDLRNAANANRLGRDDHRGDTYRICEFSEILAFYGLPGNSAALARFAATGDMSGLKSGRSFDGAAPPRTRPTRTGACPYMPPNGHQQPTVATSSTCELEASACFKPTSNAP